MACACGLCHSTFGATGKTAAQSERHFGKNSNVLDLAGMAPEKTARYYDLSCSGEIQFSCFGSYSRTIIRFRAQMLGKIVKRLENMRGGQEL
jgi:hypothetical protein